MIPNFLKSPQSKARKEARNLIGHATKVLHYRRDILDADSVEDIRNASEHLGELAGAKELDFDELRSARQRLEKLLQSAGGTIYPVTFLSENVEILLVAAILAIGIRSFFIQPFKIPTNSMWPTYAGMTAEVYSPEDPRPGIAGQAANLLFKGAGSHTVEAPASGQLLIPVVQEGNGLRVHFLPRSGYKYLVWPTVFRHYELEVGGERVSLELPQEFPLDPVVMEGLFARWVDDLEKWRWRMGAYFARALVVDSLRNIDANISGDIEAQMEEARERGILPGSFEQQIELARVRGLIARTESVAIPNSSQRLTVFWLRALGPEGNPLTFEEGEPVLDFDILTGDMLFVDRFSYHFSRPEIGDPFVFQTRDIGGLVVNGQPDDKYYIKRLVGKGGDRLRVDEPVLLRNGQPITGAEVFARQANPEDSRYRGYEARGWLSPGNIEEIPEDFFYAMGDNSPESSDSRLWGTNTIGASFRMRQRKAAGEPINFVPEKAVVGEALFIFYPFTERWGPAE